MIFLIFTRHSLLLRAEARRLYAQKQGELWTAFFQDHILRTKLETGKESVLYGFLIVAHTKRAYLRKGRVQMLFGLEKSALTMILTRFPLHGKRMPKP